LQITLKAARVNKGFTQAEAAKAIGVSEDTLWNYESGRSYPNVPIIKRIEDVYGIPYSDILWCLENTEKP
jgi:transcriptional regulator with XRE-family HTH domain